MSEINSKNIQATIKFQVGEAQIPLADLLSLNEGTVIEGNALITYFPKVRAVLNDKVIAEGELVKIDERIGFHVTKII